MGGVGRKIQARHSGDKVLPFILGRTGDVGKPPGRRQLDDPQRYPPAERFMHRPQLEVVAQLLRDVDRPDVHRIDAERPIVEALEEIRAEVAASAKSAR